MITFTEDIAMSVFLILPAHHAKQIINLLIFQVSLSLFVASLTARYAIQLLVLNVLLAILFTVVIVVIMIA